MDPTMEIIELQHYESKKWVHEGIIQKCVWDHVFYRAAKSSFLEEIYTVCVCHSGHFLCTPVAKTFGEPFCKKNKNDSDSTELGLWSLCMMT